jgi:hypothetical protein
MNSFNAFIKDKPQCFGYRSDLVPDAPCRNCPHQIDCLAVVWAVLIAAGDTNSPTQNYYPSELSQFKDRHRQVWQINGIGINRQLRAVERVPAEIVECMRERVLPSREQRSVEFARELDDLTLDGERGPASRTAPPTIEHEAGTTLPPTATQPVAATGVGAPTTSPLAATSSAVTASSGHSYQFPMPRKRPYEHHTNAELIAELKRLVVRAFHSTPALGYKAIRDEFCALHIEMNLRQQHAPRFRPTHRLKRELRTDEERAESLDRQVIDLHWRAISINKPASPANNYPTIFDSAPFDLAAAERFAQEEWPHPKKAIHLHLTEDMQWENAALQSSNIRQAWAVMERGDVREGHIIEQRGAPQIEQELREAVHRANNTQVVHSIPGMIDAWKAHQIAGNNPTKIARLIALMSGNKQRDRKAVMRTLDSLDKYLGKKGPRK